MTDTQTGWQEAPRSRRIAIPLIGSDKSGRWEESRPPLGVMDREDAAALDEPAPPGGAEALTG